MRPGTAIALATCSRGLIPGPLRMCANAPLAVSWLATDDNPSESFGPDPGGAAPGALSFNENHYRAMLADVRRTQGYVEAIKQRLAQHPPGTMTVLDLGTGPYAVLAFAAVRAGAKKVYCIEADPAVAERARQEIHWAETTIPKGTMEVIEGFSTEISLPEPVDLLVCEIAGSIASEEGMYATIGDAQRRFMKRPHEPASYIPYSYETWGAPCTDMVHHSGGPDANRKCTRVEADDETLQLLADPRLVEDIRLADAAFPSSGTVGAASSLMWRVDPLRLEANREAFRKRLCKDEAALRAQGIELAALTTDIAQSFSGIALWPRIVFDEAGSLAYDSREHPYGEHQMSHWQTFVPYVGRRPVRVEPEDVISAAWEVDLQDGKVTTPLKYSIECVINPLADDSNAGSEADAAREPAPPRAAAVLAGGGANLLLSDAVARLSGADAVGLRRLVPTEREELLSSLVRALALVQAECDGSAPER
eukprot:CAMPEP_0119062146 /NCGR_PEP_ID=MMETSP1178-20130426/5804_1 /TAXON_ID=33656 /ORGANISM="unid sp, Strain CCMP2000" /LENGTH=478 /DNA_ID=CAMNT_0007043407 /DNA_START=16 /DNA_END=1452 /DNA_ORIENTATION=-